MRWLAVILALGLVVRAGLAIRQPTTFEALPDQREYLDAGRSLAAGRGLAFFDPRFGQTVRAYRLPGYPSFVAVCGGRPAIVRAVQIAVDLSTIVAVYLIGVAVAGRRAVGLTASGIVAVDPFLAYFSTLVLTETLFTAVTTWAVWAVIPRRSYIGYLGFGEPRTEGTPGVSGLRTSKTAYSGGTLRARLAKIRGRWAVAILAIVAAAYLRPTTWVIAPLLAMSSSRGRPLGRAVLAIFVIAVGLSPWSIRNHLVIDHWLWGTTNDGVTLYDGFHPGADGGSDQRFLADFPQVVSMNEYDRSRFFTGRAVEWIRNHPAEAVVLTGRKAVRGWSPVPLSEAFGRPLYRVVGGGFSIGLFAFAVVGLSSTRIERRSKLLLTSVLIGVTVAQMISVGSIRYRMPAEPVLAVLAAAAGRKNPMTKTQNPIKTQ